MPPGARGTGGAILLATVLVGILAACSSSGQPNAPKDQAKGDCQGDDDSSSFARVGGSPGRLTLLYGGTISLAPGTAHRGRQDYELLGQTRPGVRVTRPAGATLTEEQRRDVATSLTGSVKPLAPTKRIRSDASNVSGDRNRSWAVYGVARVYHDSWGQGVCVHPAQGTAGLETWQGTFTGIGRLRTGVRPCDQVIGSRDRLDRTLRELCR